MTVRDHFGRSLALGGALAALGMGALTLTDRALAVAPPPSAGATGASLTVSSTGAQNDKPIGPLAGTVTTSTITVPDSAQPVLRDIDVRTFIAHSASGDLQIELTSPARAGQPARTVTLINGVTNRTRGTNDVFDGTLWDDSSLTAASDLDAALLGERAPQADLTPEGALGRFVGIDPRGTWTLRITDDTDEPDDGLPETPPPSSDGGTLASWSLDLSTQDVAPVVAPTITAASTGGVPIADAPAAPTTSSITVSGAKTYLTDLDLITNLTHEAPDDLEIRLSHGGRTVLIGTRVNGPTGFYANRTFDDSAGMLLNRTADAPGPVVPEGALSAFRGMDPNGVWTLSVTDAAALDTGRLDGWQLKVAATDGPLAPPPVAPPTAPPAAGPPAAGPTAPVVAPQALRLGVQTFSVARNARARKLNMRIGWRDAAGPVSYRATVSTRIGRRTVRKVVTGRSAASAATLTRTIRVPRNWRGRLVTVRLTVSDGSSTLARKTSIRRF